MPILEPNDRQRIFRRMADRWADMRSQTFHRLRETSFNISTTMTINIASNRRMAHGAVKDALADRYLPRSFRRRLESHLQHGSSVAHATSAGAITSDPSSSAAVTVNFYGSENDDSMPPFVECVKSPDHVLALKSLFLHWASVCGHSCIPLFPASCVDADLPALVQRGVECSNEHRKLNGCGPLHLIAGSNNSEVGCQAADRWAALVFDWLDLLDCVQPPIATHSTSSTTANGKQKRKHKKHFRDAPAFLTIADWLVLCSVDLVHDWRVIAALRNAYEAFRTQVASAQRQRQQQQTSDTPHVRASDLLAFMEATLARVMMDQQQQGSGGVGGDMSSGTDMDEYSDGASDDGSTNLAGGGAHTTPRPRSAGSRPTSARSRSSVGEGSGGGSTPRHTARDEVPSSVTGVHPEQSSPERTMQRQEQQRSAQRRRRRRRARRRNAPVMHQRSVAKLISCGLCCMDVEGTTQGGGDATTTATSTPRGAGGAKPSAPGTGSGSTAIVDVLTVPTTAAAGGAGAGADSSIRSRDQRTASYSNDFDEVSSSLSSVHAPTSGPNEAQQQTQQGRPTTLVPRPPSAAAAGATGTDKKVQSQSASDVPAASAVVLPLSFSTCLLLLLPHRTKMYMVKSTVRLYPSVMAAADADDDEDGGYDNPNSGGAGTGADARPLTPRQRRDSAVGVDPHKTFAAFDPRGASRFYGAVTPGAREAVFYYRKMMQREGGAATRIPKPTTKAGERVLAFEPKTKIDVVKRETRDLRYARKVWC